MFTNVAPGAPLPDLVDAFILGNALPGQQLLRLSFVSRGLGPLREAFGVPDGTPGRCRVTQVGLLQRGFNPDSAVADGFPAESIEQDVA